MGTLFWFTSASIYYRVNPPGSIPYKIANPNIPTVGKRSVEDVSASSDLPDLSLYALLDWATGFDNFETGRDAEESPVKSFVDTFSLVLTATANMLETAHG